MLDPKTAAPIAPVDDAKTMISVEIFMAEVRRWVMEGLAKGCHEIRLSPTGAHEIVLNLKASATER